MVFYLYDAPTNGNLLGNEGIASVTASNGLFTVPLSFGNVFDGNPRWLEITVQKNGSGFTTLSPRQQLTPTPYAIFANTASNLSGTLPTTQLSGAVPGASLSGTYGNVLTLNNSGNSFSGSFTGNGANVTNVNAASLGGLSNSNFWQLGGNNVAAGQFIGSTNNQPLELWVNGQRGMRLEPTATDVTHSNIVNVVNGSPVNFVAPGVYGATISGGGAGNYLTLHHTNSVSANFATVSGGAANTGGNSFATVGGGFQNTSSGLGATTGGGQANQATNSYATVPGGRSNTAGGQYSFAAGLNAQATNDGAFVWADSQGTPFGSTTTNQFNVRANGGVRFVTSGAGMTLDGQNVLTGSNGGGLTNLSASQLTGTVADARLSANVALLNAGQTFTGTNTFNSVVNFPTTNIFFGAVTRQMLNLFQSAYGIGVQDYTEYFPVQVEVLPGMTAASILMLKTILVPVVLL